MLRILSQKLLTRYRELKQEVPDGLLLMQVGAFMQVMDQDARTVFQVTGLKRQMAGEVEDPVVVRRSSVRARRLRGQVGPRRPLGGAGRAGSRQGTPAGRGDPGALRHASGSGDRTR